MLHVKFISFNILCHYYSHYSTMTRMREAMSQRNERWLRLLALFAHWSADVLCLQECTADFLLFLEERGFVEALSRYADTRSDAKGAKIRRWTNVVHAGAAPTQHPHHQLLLRHAHLPAYRYLFHARPTMADGCAILYRSQEWWMRGEDAVYFSAVSPRVSVVAVFQNRHAPHKWFSCCNVHLEGSPSMHRTRMTQLQLALHRLHALETCAQPLTVHSPSAQAAVTGLVSTGLLASGPSRIGGDRSSNTEDQALAGGSPGISITAIPAQAAPADTAATPSPTTAAASPTEANAASAATAIPVRRARIVCGDFNHSDIDGLHQLLAQEHGLHARADPKARFTTRSHRMLDYAYTSSDLGDISPARVLPGLEVMARHSRWVHDHNEPDPWPSDHYALSFVVSV